MTETDQGKSIGYKPALLIGRQFIDPAERHIICSDGDGHEKWRIAWDEITGLAFVEHSARGALMSRLDIRTPDAAIKRSLGCNSMALAPRSDPEYVAFRTTVRAIAGRLSEISPDLPVTIGEYGRTRLWMFLIGAVAVVAALGLTVALLAGGRGEAVMPVGVLLLFGLAVAWGYAPWRKQPRIPVRIFAKALDEADDTGEGDADARA